jgi:hypothetical protein
VKIASITRRPATGDAEVVTVVFSHETGDVTKQMMWGGCERACGVPPAWGVKLHRAMREAERDIAYRMFGDDWRTRVAWGPVQECELRRLSVAPELCPDLFGESS